MFFCADLKLFTHSLTVSLTIGNHSGWSNNWSGCWCLLQSEGCCSVSC